MHLKRELRSDTGPAPQPPPSAWCPSLTFTSESSWVWLLPALAAHNVCLRYLPPHLPPGHTVRGPRTHGSGHGILGTHPGLGSWDPLERPGRPRASPLTCRCYTHAFQHTGSGRVCTPVDCRTRCNGEEPAASAWSTPPNCRHAREEGEDRTVSGPQRLTQPRPGTPSHPFPHPGLLPHSVLSIVFCPMPNPIPQRPPLSLPHWLSPFFERSSFGPFACHQYQDE